VNSGCARHTRIARPQPGVVFARKSRGTPEKF
jgi:hypothetical protein